MTKFLLHNLLFHQQVTLLLQPPLSTMALSAKIAHNNHHQYSYYRFNSRVMLAKTTLRWLLFVTLALAAVFMTITVCLLLLATVVDQLNVNAIRTSGEESLGLVWLPRRSWLPQLCWRAVDCRLITAGANLRPNVAVLIVATGRYYKQYVRSLLESGRKYFCQSCSVHYFVFTDSNETQIHLPRRLWPDVTHIRQVQLGWPFDSMARFGMYKRHYDNYYKNFDYIISMDADLVFVNPVERELLGDLVGVLHLGFFGSRGSYEEAHQDSTAYVRPFEGVNYFTGGLWAASSRNFARLVTRLAYAIDEDLKRGIIAVWHDESHLNRYFIDHQPTTILSPVYHHPSNWRPVITMGDELKIVMLDKSYSQMRVNSSSTVPSVPVKLMSSLTKTRPKQLLGIASSHRHLKISSSRHRHR